MLAIEPCQVSDIDADVFWYDNLGLRLVMHRVLNTHRGRRLLLSVDLAQTFQLLRQAAVTR